MHTGYFCAPLGLGAAGGKLPGERTRNRGPSWKDRRLWMCLKCRPWDFQNVESWLTLESSKPQFPDA